MLKKLVILTFLVLTLSYSAYSGEWLPEILLTNGQGAGIQAGDTRIDLDQSNNIHLTYTEYPPWVIYYVKSDYDGNISVPDAVISMESSKPDIVVDDFDNTHIIISQAGELWYIKLDNNGDTLVDKRQVTYMESGHVASSMDIDSYGNLHIVFWNFHAPQGGGFYTKLDNNGNTLIEPFKFSITSGNWPRLSIAVDLLDNVHLSWGDYDAGAGGYGVYYRKMDNNAGILIDNMKVDNAGDWVAEGPSIDTDSDNKAHIAWTDRRHNNIGEVYYSKIDQYGNPEIDNLRLTYTDSTSAGANLVINQYDEIHLAWADNINGINGNYQIYYSKLDKNGQIIIDGQVLTDPSIYSNVTDITTDSYDNPVIALAHDGSIYFMRQEPPSNLVGYWRFNEGTGGIAYDVSGCENHGTLMNEPTWVDGLPLLGGALEFDGINDYVEVPDASSLDVNGLGITFMAWIYSPGFQNFGWIIGKGQQGPWENMVWWLLPISDDAINYAIKSGGETHEQWDIPVGLTTNIWQHVAVVYDGSYMRFYLNAEEKDNYSKTGNMDVNDAPAYIGLDGYNTANHYRGKIDEVKVYSRALSPEEIKAEFESGFVRGDANGDGIINLGDVVYLISYLYKGGPAPSPIEAGNCNCDGIVNVGDVVYLISYLYKGGPVPGC